MVPHVLDVGDAEIIQKFGLARPNAFDVLDGNIVQVFHEITKGRGDPSSSKTHGLKTPGQLLAVILVEHLFKIISVLETLIIVMGVFGKDLILHQMIHHIAEIIRGLHPPKIKDGQDHGPEFLEQKRPDALQELGPGDVLGSFEPFLAVMQGLHDEFVGLGVIAGIRRTDLRNDAVELLIHCVYFSIPEMKLKRNLKKMKGPAINDREARSRFGCWVVPSCRGLS